MIRAQLEEMLASGVFRRAERLSRFLRFVVEQTLDGHGASLKEQVIATELYGRAVKFDATTDPVVRVDARRLRDKLREYYSEFPDAPVLIGLPKGAYVPSFEMNPRAAASVSDEMPPAVVSPSIRRRGHWPALVATAVAVAVAWLALPEVEHDAPKLVPLTSYPGNEAWPSMSPDGNFVAFACPGTGDPPDSDICVKAIGAEEIQRVVQSPAMESRPSWSPDGRQIAFVRTAGTRELGIFVATLIGGSERRICDSGSGVAWAPDGKSIFVRDRLDQEPSPFAVFQLDFETLGRRQITDPRLGGGDWSFDVSPAGDALAVIRYQRPGISDLYVLPIGEGEARRLTTWNGILWGPSWTPDGNEIVYAANDQLWRISATEAKPGRGSAIKNVPFAAGHVSISRPGSRQPARLAFHSPQQQITLRKVDLDSAGGGGIFKSVMLFAPATRKDIPGPFSPDGSKVAFTSTRRSSDHELWVAASDGTRPRQLTSVGPNSMMLAHGWSPDGRRILFEAAVEGTSDLYVVPVDGGKPVKLTGGAAIKGLASWSRDGRWIYYTRVVSAMNTEIFRIPAERGAPERIAAGGSEPQESPDGRHIYYLDRPPLEGTTNARLMRIPLAGGEAEEVQGGVEPLYWSVADDGIYFLRDEGGADAILRYHFDSGTSERVGALPFRVTHRPQGRGRLTVSRDSRWALVNTTDRWEGDLMLLENFR